MDLTKPVLGLPGPGTTHGLQVWLALLAVAYVVVRGAVDLIRRRPVSNANSVLDGVTFAGSVGLLTGVFDPDVLKALGEITILLVVAALVGIVYSLNAFRR